MPKLDDGKATSPLASEPPLVARWGGFGPMRLERVTPREQHYPIFGVETSYLATPTGFGEWIPVLPGEPRPVDIAILHGPSGVSFD